MSVRVLGDGSVLLHTADTYVEAVRWVDRYIAEGDWGGYDSIMVVTDEGRKETFLRESEE